MPTIACGVTNTVRASSADAATRIRASAGNTPNSDLVRPVPRSALSMVRAAFRSARFTSQGKCATIGAYPSSTMIASTSDPLRQTVVAQHESCLQEAVARMLTIHPRFALVGTMVGVSYNFAAVDRDQLMLMPPSVAEWLPERDLVWFVLDVVDELDLSAFLAGYRVDGRGGAAYHPAMMLALLVYAYSVGERSSRRIERRCVEDVAFRVVAANQRPDHATIARFRAAHAEALPVHALQQLDLLYSTSRQLHGIAPLDLAAALNP